MNSNQKYPLGRILAVDDTPENLDLLVEMLGEEYELSVAVDGPSALESLPEVRPDLILLDIMMPAMDGFQVMENIQKQEAFKATPIIFLTAKTQLEDIVNGFQKGAVDYVTKPFNIAELKARINTHIKLRHQQMELERLYAEQNQLLHVLCHDLTNPFGSIRAISNILLENKGKDTDFMEKALPLISSASEQGLEVINLIRSMRSLEEFKVELVPLSLKEAVQASLLMLENKISEKGILVQTSIPAELKILAEHSSLVGSVINNLVTNAIKFSKPGGSLEIMASSAGDGVELLVQDHGVGMPPSIQRDLFDVSKKTSRPGTAGEQGTGFGMPLVKKFMEAYGGGIRVETSENTPNHGTKMILNFQKG